MNQSLILRYSLAFGLLFSSLSRAEESIALPEVVVKSMRIGDLNQTLNDTHLEQPDLLRSGQREITNVLRGVPGLSMTQGMKGGASNLSLRGASGGMGLVNIDGIPLHETFPGGLSLDLFPAETFGYSQDEICGG